MTGNRAIDERAEVEFEVTRRPKRLHAENVLRPQYSTARLKFLILTHGAGSNRNAPLLVAVANAFSQVSVEVIRYDLPFRQERPHGPPRPGDASLDRERLHEQVLKARER